MKYCHLLLRIIRHAEKQLNFFYSDLAKQYFTESELGLHITEWENIRIEHQEILEAYIC